MAGQGFHIGINKKLINNLDSKLFLDKRFIAGTLVPDTLSQVVGKRGYSHYTGNIFLSYPPYEKLNNYTIEDLYPVDLEAQKSYIIDPLIQLESFKEHNQHLSDSDPYKIGIFMHLLADFYYDELINNLFDLSTQSDGIIFYQGRVLTKEEFRKNLYSLYPWLDQYTYQKFDVTEEELLKIKQIIYEKFSDKAIQFLIPYINYYSNLLIPNNSYFNEGMLNQLYQRIEQGYLEKEKHLKR